ncbi:MAG: DnaJ domain-containing protein [bacterium]
MRNHYESLQVAPNASAEQVKDAFRMLLFQYHPDHNKEREEWAVQQTMGIVESYHVLSDPLRRATYDVLRGVKVRDLPEKKGGLVGLFAKTRDNSKEAEALMKRGVEAWRTDEFEQAANAFRKAFDQDAALPQVRYNLAVTFLALDRTNDALQWLSDHAAKHKDDQEARTLYGKIAGLIQRRKAGAHP